MSNVYTALQIIHNIIGSMPFYRLERIYIILILPDLNFKLYKQVRYSEWQMRMC